MRIGFTLPQFGPLAEEAREVMHFAAEAERLGADSLWVGDRLLTPVEPTVGYAGGDTIPEVFHRVLDPFAVMSAAAAVTERVEIGTNVLVGPWYAPAMLARSLTTIDRVSGGRLLVGFGTGWSPEEYRAAGVPMHERGARLDECLDVVQAWWSDDPVQYSGKHWTVPASRVDLKPARQPRPPVYLAGWAPTAMRRVAQRADGWLPAHVPEWGPFDPAEVTEPMTRIRELAREAGRDPAELDTVLRVYPWGTESMDGVLDAVASAGPDTGIDHVFVELMNLAGTVEQALEIVDRVLRAARR
ncbi:TIGR03619 family F420-dependent LLM class oxidoreductase [Saccharomonospora iraqiensis]|uniref:TIGR03619 family F420-dependent LLM class oxidoreductase n=1 Tax=Saccharomonospora iraqiensis TaxID=52698 RepID=UPI00022E2480|nr:TIGR03619 family F420-dependent LLM class oxidoreductase [Saccharomonospora iraqiensis]